MPTRLARLLTVTSALALVATTGLALPAGAEVPTCFGQPATVLGTAGDDTLHGTAGPDVIVGLGGVDTIIGGGGADRICGSDDTVGGPVTDDLLFGGSGADRLKGTAAAGSDDVGGWASGGAGDDTFVATGVSYAKAPRRVHVDLADGTASGWGHDTVSGIVSLRGSRYADVLLGNRVPLDDEGGCGCDRIDGLAGDDVVSGRAGWDWLRGGPGDDVLTGGPGSDTLLPGSGRDRLRGGAGARDSASYFTADAAMDVDLRAGVATGDGRDVLAGVEDVVGTRFADDIRGDASANTLSGAAGADRVAGRDGDDVVFGDEGRDRLLGGAGQDKAVGGAGRDTCRAETTSSCES